MPPLPSLLPPPAKVFYINVVSKLNYLAAADFVFGFTSSSLPSPPRVGRVPASIKTLKIHTFLTEVAPNREENREVSNENPPIYIKTTSASAGLLIFGRRTSAETFADKSF